MLRWQPMASMVTMAPSIASMSRSAGMATISLDLSATLTWPSTRRWRAAKADTIWIAALPRLLWAEPRQRLAVEGDHIRRHADQFGNPGDEAALKFRGVEGCENVAEMVVRRRSIPERQEPAQQCDLLLTKSRDIDEGFCSGKHREQAQQQDLIKRIDHLAALPRVRKVLKITQKNNCFALRRKVRRHRPLPNPNQRAMTDSELQSLVTSGFTRLPWISPKSRSSRFCRRNTMASLMC